MPYNLPHFNLTCNLWRGTNPLNPPTLSFLVNLSPGHRVLLGGPQVTTSATYNALPQFGDAMELMCPPATDIRGCQNGGASDIVEVPAGSSRYYLVLWVDDVGKGFANEYRLALLKQVDFQLAGIAAFVTVFGSVPPWPVPTP